MVVRLVRYFECAIEVGSQSDITRPLERAAEAIRELLAAR
jgi:hypothetical protein